MVIFQHQHFLTALAILSLAFIVLITRAMPCHNDGECSTQCERGYFGKNCLSNCSTTCQNKSCELTAIGIETCTEGCVQGFQGTSCKIPCGNPGTQCTECDGGCDGGFCKLGSASCVSGCVDSYYGLGCKNCSERCKSCNRSTGICNDCHDPYRGLNCEMACENCAGSCVSGFEGGCQPGFYGHWCDKVCSENCRPGPDTDAVSILACDQNTSINCIPKCDNNTGDCTFGCNVGWYGTNCSSRCNSKCANMSCTESGVCVDGCAPGYAGTDCSCYESCIHDVCHPHNGYCVKGCINGYYGAYCNNSCEICLNGICDRELGTCIRGCKNTDHRCKSTCTHNCPIDACLPDISCEDPEPKSLPLIIIGTSAACLLCLVGIVVPICIGYYKRRHAKRKKTDDEEVECPVEQMEARDYELVDFENETGPVVVDVHI